MNENLVRVVCLSCGTSFRVDPAAIPDEGAMATCKHCGHRFFIPKTASDPVAPSAPVAADAAPESVPPPASGPPVATAPREEIFTCPKCGHKQTQAFTCYACGAVITPRKPSPGPTAPPPVVHPQPVPVPDMHLEKEMGEIVVRTRLLSGGWAKPYTKPHIFIDGMDHARDWGVHAFKAIKGECEVAVEYRFFLWTFGKNAVTVQVKEKDRVYVGYDVAQALSNVRGRIACLPLVEGVLWQVTAGTGQPSERVKSDKNKVILSLALLGPFGLVSLWKSDAFSMNAKIAISAGMVVLTLFFISKI
jgi:predicted Zn finger-like uncharacterized protein